MYKAELIRGPDQGPWKTVDDVELATLGGVTWFNTVRIHGTLNDVPPAEYEAAYHHQTEPSHPVGSNEQSLHRTQGGSKAAA